MGFFDKIVFFLILIVLMIVLHYLLPKLNYFLDGKEGMKNKKGGVLSTNKRADAVKPNSDVNTNGDANGDTNDDENGDDTNNSEDSTGNSYHVHYHMNSDSATTFSSANLTHMPTGDPQQDVNNAQSQFSSVDESSETPQTSEYTSQFPCQASVTGTFTECGPPAANSQCFNFLYGSSIDKN